MLYQIDSSYTCMKNLNGNVTVNKIKKNQRQLLLNLSHIVREWYSDF